MNNSIPPKILKAIQEHRKRQERRYGKYGEVRDTISFEMDGVRVVTIGDRIMWNKNWKTFHDFLITYLKTTLGIEWGKSELTKSPGQQHVIIQWFTHLGRFMREHQSDPVDGVYSADQDGIVAAFLSLAYDLYALRHHSKLQESLLVRLKHTDQFQGARYELFVIAAFLRAGLEPQLEDEGDVTKRHPEFRFLDTASGLEVEVEAKSRHRPGVLGRDGDFQSVDELKPGVHNLLRDAASKASGIPFVVFVDVNLPPPASLNYPDWIKGIQTEVARVAEESEWQSSFDLLFFTNVPHHYGKPDESVPQGHIYEMRPMAPKQSRIPVELADRIVDAVNKHDNVPRDFEE